MLKKRHLLAMEFAELAGNWWDPMGPMRPLHALNPQRLDYIRQRLDNGVAGKTILDIGCGGGIVCEPLARLGARMTGIDLSPELIKTAKTHAEAQQLEIDYRAVPVQEVPELFDVVLALEVVEHVDDPRDFVRAAANRVKPGGVLILSTLNRTLKSLLLGKIAAEYIVRWVPAGTHEWDKFIKPSELVAHCEAVGMTPVDLCGLRYAPRTDDFHLDPRDIAVNYFLTCIKKG